VDSQFTNNTNNRRKGEQGARVVEECRKKGIKMDQQTARAKIAEKNKGNEPILNKVVIISDNDSS
jgi:hypothetical protein